MAAKADQSGLLGRRTLLASLAGLAIAPRSFAQLAPPLAEPHLSQPSETALEMQAWLDKYGRPTARVALNGAGEYSFLVDTGANTTVISMRVALAIGAPFLGMVTVNGTTGTADMPVARIAELATGVARRKGIDVAVAPDDVMGREDGILGADVFFGRRLSFDISGRTVRVQKSEREPRVAPITNVRIRNGTLAELSGRIGKVPTRMMLDTGAQHCIMNMPLSNELLRLHPRLVRYEKVRVTGVTGHTIVGDYIELPKVQIADLSMIDGGAVAADAPIFKVWGFDKEPAMILGVDVLSRLDRFSIDYGARRFDAEPMAMIAGNRNALT